MGLRKLNEFEIEKNRFFRDVSRVHIQSCALRVAYGFF